MGRGFYQADPAAKESVSLGAYELFENQDFQSQRELRRKRRVDREKRKRERKSGGSAEAANEDEEESRPCGRDDETSDDPIRDPEDTFAWIKTWLSARAPGADAGGWVVEGHVRQLPAEQFRYAVQRAGQGWDIVRQHTRQVDAAPRGSRR